MGQKAVAVAVEIGLIKIGSVRNCNVRFIGGKLKGTLKGKLRFVGKNGGNIAAETVAHRLFVGLVGGIYKAFNRLFRKGVDIRLIIKPGGGSRRFHIGVPNLAGRLLVFLQHFIRNQIALRVELNVVAGKQYALAVTGYHRRGIVYVFGFALAVIGRGGEKYVFLAVFVVFGNIAAAVAGRPLIFIVKPGEHIAVFGFFYARANKSHKFIRQISCRHTHAGMHVETAEPHLLHAVDFGIQQRFIKFCIPCPKRSRPVFGGWMFEQFKRYFPR